MNSPTNLLRKYFSLWTILAGFLLGVILFGALVVTMWAIHPQQIVPQAGSPVINKIVAPTITQPVVISPPTATPTSQPEILPPPPGDISVGAYVQITGTGTDGLRLRATPGLQGTIKFLGIEAEVFQVTDGPQEADGYTWWFLTAPYDETVHGWAVANYMRVIQNP